MFTLHAATEQDIQEHISPLFLASEELASVKEHLKDTVLQTMMHTIWKAVPNKAVFVVAKNTANEIIGFAACEKMIGGYARLIVMFVDANYRRNKIGTQMMQYLQQELKATKYHTMFWTEDQIAVHSNAFFATFKMDHITPTIKFSTPLQ